MAQVSYSTNLFYPVDFNRVVIAISEKILEDQKKLNINCIACSGYSSSIIVGAIAYETRFPIILVRKEGESTHSSYLTEYAGDLKELNAVFVDDFICSGATFRRVRERIETNDRHKGKLLKIYLYQSCGPEYEEKYTTSDGKTKTIKVWRIP